MKNIVLIPDSFKGTMSSTEICDIMENAILKHYPNINITKIPVADGGEGTVDCFLQAVGGKKINLKVCNPYLKKIDSFYGLLDNDTAVIEMSAAAGLPLIEKLNPKLTSTYGVGELILDAINKGAKKIIIGLGGSATNDCGLGCFAALGAKFFDSYMHEFIPTGGTLSRIKKIDTSMLKLNIKNIEFITMCDINNPLYGQNGAVYQFSRQKGATNEDMIILENEVKTFANYVKKEFDSCDVNFEGAGAAGGMGFGMKTFLNSKMQMGIDTILDVVEFDKKLTEADLVISGEGKFDSQSFSGKVIMGIAEHTKKYSVPLIAVVGDIDDNIDSAYDRGVTAIYSINRVAKEYKDIKNRSKSDLSLTVDTIFRTVKMCENIK